MHLFGFSTGANSPMNANSQSFRQVVLFLYFICMWLGLCTIGKGATLITNAVLNPMEDASVRAGFNVQKKNFGGESVLELQGGKSEATAYLKFDLTDVDSFVKQAFFRFYAGAESPSVVTVTIKSLSSKSWSENSITWKDKPEAGSTLAQVQLVGTSPGWYEVDLTAALKAELAAGNATLDLVMETSDPEGNKVSINSREATSNKPELVLLRSSVKVRIVFRPTTTGAPPGYLVDNGTIYGPHSNGFTYGWNQEMTKFLADRNSTAHAVPKQARSPDSRYASCAAMDHPELEKPAFWGISLPNGTYNVHIVAGDPGFYDSVYALNINDTLVLEGIPDQAKRWVESTKPVTVNNQKLIITNNPKGINNKLCFIEVQEVIESGK